MRNFFEKIMVFMQGRYGMDTLNGFILALSFVIWTVNIFVFNRLAHYIIMVVQLLLVALTYKRIRDHKDYRYIKCPVCKAQLRVKNIKGRHNVRCPKCKSEFEKKI